MKLVLDASVAIASVRPGEPAYAAARARMHRVLQGLDELVQPSTFRVEVGGALARLGRPEAEIRRLVDPLCAPPHAIVRSARRGPPPPKRAPFKRGYAPPMRSMCGSRRREG